MDKIDSRLGVPRIDAKATSQEEMSHHAKGSLAAADLDQAKSAALKSGRELDRIQFLLGHVSVQTTERYLGRKPRIRNAVNDRIWDPAEMSDGFGRLGVRLPINQT
jgi:integrase